MRVLDYRMHIKSCDLSICEHKQCLLFIGINGILGHIICGCLELSLGWIYPDAHFYSRCAGVIIFVSYLW